MDTELVDSRRAIALLISANGNLDLAAARSAVVFGRSISRELLMASIANNPESIVQLAQQLRLLTVVQAFDAFRLTHRMFLERLPDMAPSVVARTYTSILQLLLSVIPSNVVDASTSVVAPPQASAILNALPPEVASAVEALLRE